jgi:hypothetical protein
MGILKISLLLVALAQEAEKLAKTNWWTPCMLSQMLGAGSLFMGRFSSSVSQATP